MTDAGWQAWDVVIRCASQLRLAPNAAIVIGIDLAVGAALGHDVQALAELLPAAEAGVVAAFNRGLTSDIAAPLSQRIADLAREILGEPNRALSTQTQLRYGTKGSVAVEIGGEHVGGWFDDEQGVGGDGLELIRHRLGHTNGEACDWAREGLSLCGK